MIADDWSPIAGCYGNPVIRTPNVDRLASEGIRFNHAFCASPSCAASRATVLTGLHSHAHGQYGHCHHHHTFRVKPNTPTLPSILGQHGIETGIVGKRHVFPPDLFPWSFALDENLRDQDSIVAGAERFLNQAEGKPFCLYVGFSEPHRGLGGFNDSKSSIRLRK